MRTRKYRKTRGKTRNRKIKGGLLRLLGFSRTPEEISVNKTNDLTTKVEKIQKEIEQLTAQQRQLTDQIKQKQSEMNEINAEINRLKSHHPVNETNPVLAAI